MNSDMQDFELPKGHFLFTSESVTQGHPDKLCDLISDSILDACLEQDPDAKVACESGCKSNMFMVFGEITTKANISHEEVVREAVKQAGYDHVDIGADYRTCTVLVAIEKQSLEIAKGVHEGVKEEDVKAGDQGLMIGYACDETKNLMPLSHDLALKLCERLHECRKQKILKWLRPDGKTQVTVEYKRTGTSVEPVRVHTVLVSCQHDPNISHDDLEKEIIESVIKEVVPKEMLDEKTRFYVNPSGSFIVGGPTGDAGLTGRKIIVDTYGGWGGHGGGAFSGKDPTKVDRSGAYAARWVAKSLVANKLCKRAMVQLSYAIGRAEPLSVLVDTYGTVKEGLEDHDLQKIVMKNFNLKPGMIIKDLKLKRPIYKKLSALGHFGREDPDFLWEMPKTLKL